VLDLIKCMWKIEWEGKLCFGQEIMKKPYMMNTFRIARDSVTPGHRDDRLKFFWKRKGTNIWHLVLRGKDLVKESSPSIMVTRNPNRSIEILWYKTGYAKRKILSPLKRPTWGRLRCWFYFILLRICSPLLFFCSSYHVSDSSVSEQYLQIFPTLALVNIAQIQKNMIFLTLAPMNKYTKFVLKEKRNYFYFFMFFLLFV